jgi:hypothetical protein
MSARARLRGALLLAALLALDGCVAVGARVLRAVIDGAEPSATPSSASQPDPGGIPQPTPWRAGS